MQRFLAIVIFGAFLFPENGVSQENFFNHKLNVGEATSYTLFSKVQKTDHLDQGSRKSLTRSPAKGILLSLVLPGSGQFYAGQRYKSVLFLATEIGGWLFAVIHHNKAREWETRYRNFADDNWIYERWLNWWHSLSPAQKDHFPVYELPSEKNSEYYSMIGKYEKFNAGWSDVEINPGSIETSESLENKTYLKWRKHSHDEYRFVTIATALLITNHIVSAFDAALTIRILNRDIKTKAEPVMVMSGNQPVLAAGLTFSW